MTYAVHADALSKSMHMVDNVLCRTKPRPTGYITVTLVPFRMSKLTDISPVFTWSVCRHYCR